jgi:hypothetical protein
MGWRVAGFPIEVGHALVSLFRVPVLAASSLDDDDTNDEVTADMFVSFCRQHGFVPPATGAGASILF